MSASESSPLSSNLQESIEHLIAETVRRSKVVHEEEQTRLREALKQALSEVEAGQAAMARAAEVLRAALDTHATVESPAEPITEFVETAPAPEALTPVGDPESIHVQANANEPVASDAGPRDLDVVAHNINFRIAGSLQKWLNERTEVQNARTRSYVDSELHLELKIASSISDTDLKTWLAEHNGTIATQTSSVLELRFES